MIEGIFSTLLLVLFGIGMAVYIAVGVAWISIIIAAGAAIRFALLVVLAIWHLITTTLFTYGCKTKKSGVGQRQTNRN